MRNSTLHRSGLSKERIAALEELISDNSNPYDSSPGVYVRSDKDRELDILWQGFKVNGREERSPGVYLSIGFVTGAICMFLMTVILNFGNTSHESFIDLNIWKKMPKIAKSTPVSVAPATPSAQPSMETYTIQSGDTLEKVAIRYYGSSSPEKIMKIQQANKLDNPNKISIGQKLNVPVEK